MLDSLDNPPAVVDAKDANDDGVKGSSMPTDKHQNVDKPADESNKEVPKATDKPEPQTGAPSAPISQ